MADPMSGPGTRCPWCSAELSDALVSRCPSCGAVLVAASDAPDDIKGVTTLDTEAILRARSEPSRSRNNRILSFITGEIPAEAEAPIDPGSLARPDIAVRREMLRLQIEAETADLEAERIALKADELARRGIHLSELGAPPPATGPVPPGDTGAAEAHETAPAGEWPTELDPGADPGGPSQR